MLPNIKNDLVVLEKPICNIIKEELKNNNFNMEEYNLSKGSKYYSHIDFDKIS